MSLTIPAALRPWVPLVTIVLCAFAFDRLFYDLAIGVNLLLFVVLVLGLLLQRIGWKQFSAPARATTLGTVLAATMVVVHNSGIAIFMTVVSLGTCTALVHEPRLRSSFFTMAQLVSNYITLPLAAWQGSGELMPQRGAARAGWRWGRLAVLPLLVGIVFFQLYRVGNPKFDALTAGFLDGLWVVFGDFIEFFFTPRLFFFLFAMIVCGGLLYRFAPRLVLQIEEDLSDRLERVRTKRPSWMAPRSMNPLERERRMGLVLLVLVNALLLVVNIIDINWVWFGFEVPEGFSLKQFVHEGTWILIISIMLSMLILLHLFRRNQNFYARSGSLRTLGLVWVAQNLVLGISVFLRNYHYIDFHGLAYLRIGVIVFLVLVLVGLITLYIKIRHQRSFFYLARVNGWAAFAVLIAMTTVDWDRFIVRTNLQHKNPGEIDIDNYLALSDRVLPLVYANIELVELQMARHRTNRVRWVDHLEPEGFRAALDAKRDRFLERYSGQRWQERNWADTRTMQMLRSKEEVPRP
ncbi:MAG: DUF4173 domain-containing protein [Flavobacteriales bacterium]|nr:DUF4173 domain-containing protein [Flavobacteriales bacterium]